MDFLRRLKELFHLSNLGIKLNVNDRMEINEWRNGVHAHVKWFRDGCLVTGEGTTFSPPWSSEIFVLVLFLFGKHHHYTHWMFWTSHKPSCLKLITHLSLKPKVGQYRIQPGVINANLLKTTRRSFNKQVCWSGKSNFGWISLQQTTKGINDMPRFWKK